MPQAVVYYFGDSMKDGEDYTLDPSIHVEAAASPTTPESASGYL